MKRNISIMAVALLMGAMCFVSCNKDEGAVDLTANIADRISGNSKVYIDANNYACWHDNDAVNINGTVYRVVSNETSSATISGVAQSESYTAAYPAENVTVCSQGYVSMKIPSTQSYITGSNGKQNVVNPMVGYTESTTLAFHNVASIIRVNVTNDLDHDLTIKGVELASDKALLCGEGTVSVSDGNVGKFVVSTGHKNLSLTCNQTVVNGTTQEFYLVVAPFENAATITVNIYADDETNHYFFIKTGNSELTIAPNTMGVINASIDNATEHTVSDFLGEGTEGNPYQIGSLHDLNMLRTKVNGGTTYSETFFKLTQDIDASAEDWVAIGTNTYKFQGTLDGDGHTVTMKMNPNQNGYGFFGYINGASIKNLTVSGECGSNNTNYEIGGIVGNAAGVSSIDNCVNTIPMQGKYDIAGIVGALTGATTITKCINNGAITAKGSASSKGVAGIVARASATTTISKCKNTGVVTGSAGNSQIYLGGIIGISTSSLTMNDCTNTGSLAPNKCFAAAGLVGQCRGGGTPTITNSYNRGSISTTTTTTWGGGITTAHNGTKPTLSNCYFSGELTGTFTYQGDMASYGGSSNTVSATNCYTIKKYSTSGYSKSANYTIDAETGTTTNNDKPLVDALNANSGDNDEWVEDGVLAKLSWEN